MVIGVQLDTSGIADYEFFLKSFPERTKKALALSINDTMRDVVLPLAREQIEHEVMFPTGYVNDDRLKVTQFATPTRLEGRVAGRGRATSLYRFSDAPPPGISMKGRPAVQVTVHPGRPKKMGRAFAVRLNSANIGLAIRLRPGEKLQNIREYTPVQIFKNVYLLYGPSVDQVFQGVAVDIEPKVMVELEKEFYRQFERLSTDA
jgi:hypothetical protein